MNRFSHACSFQYRVCKCILELLMIRTNIKNMGSGLRRRPSTGMVMNWWQSFSGSRPFPSVEVKIFYQSAAQLKHRTWTPSSKACCFEHLSYFLAEMWRTPGFLQKYFEWSLTKQKITPYFQWHMLLLTSDHRTS